MTTAVILLILGGTLLVAGVMVLAEWFVSRIEHEMNENGPAGVNRHGPRK